MQGPPRYGGGGPQGGGGWRPPSQQQQPHHEAPQFRDVRNQPQQQPQKIEKIKSLWLGDTSPDWNERIIQSFLPDRKFRVTMRQGYCFLDFESHEEAASVLRDHGGRSIPGEAKSFALRWAGVRTSAPKDMFANPAMNETSVFVGDLDYKITEDQLMHEFKKRYRSTMMAKIVVDQGSGNSKGFGFVRFGDPTERDRAITEMHGTTIGDRQIRVTHAATREERGLAPMVQNAYQGGRQPIDQRGFLGAPKATEEGENTCVFVGGLDESVTPDMLRHHFGLLGDIGYIRIPPGRGCGFVGFVHRKNAEAAISTLQGLRINGYKVRLSWGSMRNGIRSAAAKNQNPLRTRAPLPGTAPTAVVTQFKKEHKTPAGALTQEYNDVLPEPPDQWDLSKKQTSHEGPLVLEPPPSSSLDPDDVDDDDNNFPRTKKTRILPPAGPYVAQLKARYAAYNAAMPKPPLDKPKGLLVDNYRYADSSLRPGGEPSVTGVEIPMQPPPFLTANPPQDAALDTPMALYL